MSQMTLAELEEYIAIVRDAGADDDTPVHVAYNYGDHWATRVAPQAGDADLLNVVNSSYHQMDKLTEDNGEEQEDGSRLVFVIS